MIVIIDLGLGNIASVANMLDYIGIEWAICQTPEGIPESQHFILPGVGAFDSGAAGLQRSGWGEFIQRRDPAVRILGICLGMQLLGSASEEGVEPGLGLIPADFVRFDPRSCVVPQMGWNEIDVVGGHPLFAGLSQPPRFYFTHSYHAICEDPADSLATADHGESFVAAYGRGNTFGVQFHPEKSHQFGIGMLSNFAGI